jgi:glycosyltransferase involved in cell wall biosynthesis
MRVMNVNHLMDPVTGGGTAERTFQMSRSLAKAGVDCCIVTTSIGLTPERRSELADVDLFAYPCLSERFYLAKVPYRELRRLLARVDMVHLMGHWTYLNALVYIAARRMKKPYVLCPAGALPIYGRSRTLKTFYNRIIGRRIVADADGYIAITPDEIGQFRSYGVAANRVTVIPNAVDSAEFLDRDDVAFRHQYGLGEAPFILFVGRLNSIKGPDLLVKAFVNLRDRLPNYHLVLAGPDGGMLSSLRDLVSASGLGGRVHFTGYLGGADKSRAYHAAKMLVVPSRQEAMSIVVLEAGITGTPVLITDRCGFDDVASVGGGQVVPASVAGLQTGLQEMVEDPARLQQMGSNLGQYTREHFAWDSIVNQYVQLYQRILGEKN